jgi:hypothetical protein
MGDVYVFMHAPTPFTLYKGVQGFSLAALGQQQKDRKNTHFP